MKGRVDERHFHPFFAASGESLRVIGADERHEPEGEEEQDLGSDDETAVLAEPMYNFSLTIDDRPNAQADQNDQSQQQSPDIVLRQSQSGEQPEDESPDEQAEGASQCLAAVRQRGEEMICQREGDPAEEGDEDVPGEEREHLILD